MNLQPLRSAIRQRRRAFFLRLAGAETWQRHALLDDRRYSIVATDHAVDQATQRYRTNDPLVVIAAVAEVAAA